VPGWRLHRGQLCRAGRLIRDEWTFAGTQTGPLRLPDGTQLPPTGKPLEIKGMELVQVRDGKIVIDNLYYDAMAILAQVGLLPQGATT
jgi:predicted ester cyclase